MEVLVVELHHRGSKMVYHTPVPPQRRFSNAPALLVQIFEVLRIVSSEEAA